MPILSARFHSFFSSLSMYINILFFFSFLLKTWLFLSFSLYFLSFFPSSFFPSYLPFWLLLLSSALSSLVLYMFGRSFYSFTHRRFFLLLLFFFFFFLLSFSFSRSLKGNVVKDANVKLSFFFSVHCWPSPWLLLSIPKQRRKKEELTNVK